MLKIVPPWLHSTIAIVIIIMLTLTAILGLPPTLPAIAAIQQFEEQPGQTVYQTRHTLKDQQSRSWQAIAFKRIKPDGTVVLNLRLAGFPGSTRIDRTQPLQFRNSFGEVLTAEDASSEMFSDTSAPEPHIGQYNLQPIVSDLRIELPWRLTLPTESGTAITFSLPPTFLADWKTLDQQTND
ncbi:DUF3122 domain-containing protein [Alkalinema pantanalense CENA528]|uniref:DUF3122 domain-containing protein n=1 Tax=Alkalinema pantanalense TaxID=1620705 RepID=UPI003D6E444C